LADNQALQVQCNYIYCKLFILCWSSLGGVWVFDYYKCIGLQVRQSNVTRLCNTKPLITVNGQYPGPTIFAQEGDQVIIKLVNHVKDNVTIHW